MTRVLVLGTGLIGTSLGLALSDGQGANPSAQGETYDVLLSDIDAGNARTAVQRGAGRLWDGYEAVDIVVAAGPPRAIPAQLQNAQQLGLASTYTHVSSIQSQVQREVEALGCDMSSVVGGHPLAGRETSGPAGARADLFFGRPWAVCSGPETTTSCAAAVVELARAAGAEPVELTAQEHDHAVAVLSHLPQVVASALAGQLVTQSGNAAIRTELSGPGLADTTRLAASSSALWTEILTANSDFVAPAVRGLAAALRALGEALEQGTAGRSAVSDFLDRGHRGRALVPVKRGVRDIGFTRVAVTVDDRPGRLAALLADAGRAHINVEDVQVDHLPGRPTGVIELLVEVEAGPPLAAALAARGWRVRHDDEST